MAAQLLATPLDREHLSLFLDPDTVTAAIDRLEHDVGLLRLNLNENAALEEFLLSSLRLWSKR